MVSVTALGDLQGHAPILRSGARPGDLVAVAGRLGWSAAGWELLERGRAELAPELVAAHRRPTPPYAAGVAASLAGATSMLDVSDGLVRDLGRVARASGVSIDLDWNLLADTFARPLWPANHALGRPETDAMRWVLSGGEDHALAATFARSATLPAGFVPVGEVLPAIVGRPPVLLDGEQPDVLGWDHFRR
jgi:thiamine-monophosphate kinase